MKITLRIEADGFHKEAVSNCSVPDHSTFELVVGELVRCMRESCVDSGRLPFWCSFCKTEGHMMASCPVVRQLELT